MVKKRGVLLVLIGLLLLSTIQLVEAQGDKVLKITTHELAYANLFKDLKFPEDTSNMTLEYKIKGQGINGYSWGGGVFIYWDPQSYIGLRLNDSIVRNMRNDILGVRQGDLFSVGEGDDWLEVRVSLTISDIFLYVKTEEAEEWSLTYQGSRPINLFFQPLGLVIGTGYRGDNPYLRNSNVDLRSSGSLYIDDIVLKVGDKVIFEEDFEKSMDDIMAQYDVAWDPANKEPVIQVVSVE
jgi:hypothetical protein